MDLQHTFTVPIGIDEAWVAFNDLEGIAPCFPGAVITSAGLVLAGTFAALGTLPVVAFAEIGFAVALGVLLDTFVVRSVLVTSLFLDAGPRVWWPHRLSREEPGAVARQLHVRATAEGAPGGHRAGRRDGEQLRGAGALLRHQEGRAAPDEARAGEDRVGRLIAPLQVAGGRPGDCAGPGPRQQ